MSDGDDLYSTLGLTADATEREIADAYQSLGPSASVGDAYDILGDQHRRRVYDDTRRTRADAAFAAASSKHRAPPGTADIELSLTFDQAALGTTASVRVDIETACSPCAGSGLTGSPGGDCAECGGAGSRPRQSGGITIRYECRTCEGSGRKPPATCENCGGAGITAAAHDVTIRVPPGVTDGTRLRFLVPHPSGERERFAVVRCSPHPYFDRTGHHLTLHLPITIAEAALGAVVTVPTLRGAVAVRIPQGTPHGRTLRVRGQGTPSPTGPGDLLVTIDIVIPVELTEAQRRALEAFAAATPSPRTHLEGPRRAGRRP